MGTFKNPIDKLVNGIKKYRQGIKDEKVADANKKIANAKADYQKAKAQGDYAGMRMANQKANKVRKSIGQKEYSSEVGDKQFANTLLKNKGFTDTVKPNLPMSRSMEERYKNAMKDKKSDWKGRYNTNPNTVVNQGMRMNLENSPSTRAYRGVMEGFGYGVNPISTKKGQTEYMNKLYGEDMTKRLQGSTPYKAGNVLGNLVEYGIGYELGGGAVMKGLSKVPKLAPKIANMGKLGKAVTKSVASDLTVGNVLGANDILRKEGLKGEEAGKAFGKNMGINLALGLGFEGAGHVLGKVLGKGAKAVPKDAIAEGVEKQVADTIKTPKLEYNRNVKGKSGRAYKVALKEEVGGNIENGVVSIAKSPLDDVNPLDYKNYIKQYADVNLITHFDDKGNMLHAKPITIKSDGKQVIITKTGIADVLKTVRKGEKSKVISNTISVLDKLIENSKFIKTLDNAKDRVNSFSYYRTFYKEGDILYNIELAIKDTPDISRYHYHSTKPAEIERIKITETAHGTHTKNSDVDQVPASVVDTNIPQNMGKVNKKITEVPDGAYTQTSDGNLIGRTSVVDTNIPPNTGEVNKKIAEAAHGTHTKNSDVDLFRQTSVVDSNIPPNGKKGNKNVSENAIGADKNKNINTYGEALHEYGAMKKGGKFVDEDGNVVTRHIPTPKGTPQGDVSQAARTMLESKNFTSDKAVDSMMDGIADGIFNKYTKSHKTIVDNANDTINKANGDFSNLYTAFTENSKAGKMFTDDDVALGIRLTQELEKQGDMQKAMDIASELVNAFSESGRTLQAARLLKRLTPEGRLASVMRFQDRIHKLSKSKLQQLEIPDEMIKRVLKAKTEREIAEANIDISVYLWNQVPVSAWERIDAWRHTGMLGNAKTQVRNILGNALFVPTRKLKDIIGVKLEQAFIKNGERTKAFLDSKKDKHYIDFAKEQFHQQEYTLKGEGKFAETMTRPSEARIFKFTPLEKWRKATTWALDKGDMIFLKNAYVESMAKYLKANNVKLNKMSKNVLEKAQEHASREALEATYRDFNSLANAINRTRSGLKNSDKIHFKAAGMVMDGILPYTKTPLNVMRRGIEYSPVGLMHGIKQMMFDIKAGRVTATEAINNLSKGLSGSATTLLGLTLGYMGFVNGKLHEDSQMARELNKTRGSQSYAINVGDFSYTIDWTAPIAMPFFVGVELANSVKKKGYNLGDVLDTLGTLPEPMFSLSMVQGVNSALQTVRDESSGGALAQIAQKAMFGYAGQFVPSLFAQTARTIDPVIRNTRSDKKGIANQFDAFRRNQQAKIPVLSKGLEPRIDILGNERTGGSLPRRAFANFLSPGNIGLNQHNLVADEMGRMADMYGKEALPSDFSGTLTYNGQKVELNNKEQRISSQIRGKEIERLLKDKIGSEAYKSLPEDKKQEALSKIYKKASNTAKEEILSQKYGDKIYTEQMSKKQLAGYKKLERKMSAKEYTKAVSSVKSLKLASAQAVELMKNENFDTEVLTAMGFSEVQQARALVLRELGMSGDEFVKLVERVKKARGYKKGALAQKDVIKYIESHPETSYEEGVALWAATTKKL